MSAAAWKALENSAGSSWGPLTAFRGVLVLPFCGAPRSVLGRSGILLLLRLLHSASFNLESQNPELNAASAAAPSSKSSPITRDCPRSVCSVALSAGLQSRIRCRPRDAPRSITMKVAPTLLHPASAAEPCRLGICKSMSVDFQRYFIPIEDIFCLSSGTIPPPFLTGS